MDNIERKKDGIFVGNTLTKGGIPNHLRQLTTVRVGEQAIDINGEEIPKDYYRPLFVGKQEAKEYDRIMMSRMHRH